MTVRLLVIALIGGCAPPATLTEVQAEVFTPSCAFSSCHGGGAGDLDLTEGLSHGELVDVPAAGVDAPTNPDVDVSGEILVIPGDSDNSYLIKKIRIGATGIKGSPMPDGTDGLDDALVDRVASWIANGALDD